MAEAFAPSNEAVDSVKTWLASAGISDQRIKHAQGLNWLDFDATVDEAESLLRTKFYMFEHTASGQPHVACEEYSVPTHLQEHIDIITPTVHFDAKIKALDEAKYQEKREDTQIVGRNSNAALAACSQYTTPTCLRDLYGIPVLSQANSNNSFGIVEFTPGAYVPSDLDLFFKQYNSQQVGARPILDSIDGGVVQQTNKSFSYNGESDMDLEWAMTLVYPQKVTLYQTGDTIEKASFNTFLDAIDSAYCTYEGGDSSSVDPVYPDTQSGGYKGAKNCGGFAATKVISTSFNYDEHALTTAYEMRQCNEYMKLGLMGISMLYSSGDNGVAGNGGQCNSGRFNPSFPGTCPYITSVGATQVNSSANTADTTTYQLETACETNIYSGGGFSNVFSMPSYQKTAVQAYFANYSPSYTAAQYNNSKATRGFPDVSANGANYVIAVDGQFALVSGTSASSPTFGAILTLINNARLNAGKSSIGFVNPTLYANPSVLNDITSGSNPGCDTSGFSAEPGWDPVTVSCHFRV